MSKKQAYKSYKMREEDKADLDKKHIVYMGIIQKRCSFAEFMHVVNEYFDVEMFKLLL